MRRTALAVVGGLILAAVGFTAAAFASGDHHRWGNGTTTATTSTTATTGTTSTTATTTTAPTTTTTASGHKVIVCHRTGSRWHAYVTISIDDHALRAHMRHGDKVGACTVTQTVPTTTTATTATTTTAPTTTTTTSFVHGRRHKLVACKVVYVHAGRLQRHQHEH